MARYNSATVSVKFIYCFLTLLCFPFISFPQHTADVENNWSASWISDAFPQDLSNSWIDFKQACTIDEEVTSAQLKIAVDSKYWLWINGVLVIREGGLKRGPTPTDTYYDEVNLEKHLHTGMNTIEVRVWYFGKNGFSHHSSGRSGLLFELSVNNKTALISNEHWKTRIHPAYQYHNDDPQPNFRLSESDVVFDARKDIEWTSSLYDKRQWHEAYVIGKPGCAPWNKLIKRPIPQWKNYELKSYLQAPTFPFISKGDTVKCKLPYNAQVTPYLKVESVAGNHIIMLMDNYQGGSEYNLKAKYITKDGIQEYESLGWINGHYMYYVIPAGVKVLDLKYRESGYDTEFAGSFTCENPFFNRLWDKAKRTLYVTMRDSYMDCPDRERAQWWGDVVNESGETFYALSQSSHLLTKKAILELVRWQRADSILFSPVPAGNWDRELPLQMLNSIGHYGVWNYYLHTGDTATLLEAYPAIKKYLALWKLNSQGLVIGRQGAWSWGDWGDNVDMEILYNMWYYLSCKSFKSMAELFNQPEDAQWANDKINSIATNFNTVFWNGKEYRSPAYRDATDDRSNAMTILAGLALPKDYSSIKDVLMKNEHASPYMEKYVIEALFMMGYEEEALERLEKRFTGMVKSDITTLWEGWELGEAKYGGGTYNHAWSGGGLTILSQWVGGIYPLEPGYQKVRIHPHLRVIKDVQCTVESVRGKIEVNSNFTSPNKFVQKISCPKQIELQIQFPFDPGKIKRLTINKKTLKANALLEIVKNSFLELQGGIYSIEAELN